MHKRNRKKGKKKDQHTRKINRKYKDSLFRKIFTDKKDLLELYNALNHTEYSDERELTVTTLEDVVYLSMKNDVSFLLGGTMNLYEHQSTCNPNMPVRGLMYFSRLYQDYIDKEEINIFSTVLKRLPFPNFIVFYNGTKETPDEEILKLSDAFGQSEAGREPSLECRAVMLNINYGHNLELMKKCQRLEEYSVFVSEVRKAMETGRDMREAVDSAVDTCIENGILRDILIRERAEVINMILSCTKRQYERLARKEVEQLDKMIRDQESKMRRQRGRIEEQESEMRRQRERIEEQESEMRRQKDMIEEQESEMRRQRGKIEEQERLLQLTHCLVREKRFEDLEKIENDEKLCRDLMQEYDI